LNVTDLIAPSARPARAAIAWCDKTSIFVEYSTPSGHPYVARFPKSVVGLAQAFGILVESPTNYSKATQVHPDVKKIAKGATSQVSDEQRARVQGVLRKLRIVE
jgi:hypothetical protein